MSVGKEAEMTMETHKMRRADRQLEQNETIKILQKNKYGVLSTIGPDGFPYGVPITYIYEDGKIYFHSALEGHKLDNIEFSKKASFCVVGNTHILPERFSTQYESIIAFGEIRELLDAEKREFLTKIVEILAPDYKEKGVKYIQGAAGRTRVFCLDVVKVTGKARR